MAQSKKRDRGVKVTNKTQDGNAAKGTMPDAAMKGGKGGIMPGQHV